MNDHTARERDGAALGVDEPDGRAAAVTVLDRDGRQFGVVDADEQTTLDAFLDAAAAVRTGPDVGVVARAPAEAATAVQRLVDEVEDSARTTLEMVDAEVVETVDGYQYRSYLTEVSDR